jgi:hypothetical protein
LPLDALQAVFGATGQQLYQLAHGIDMGRSPRPATLPASVERGASPGRCSIVIS